MKTIVGLVVLAVAAVACKDKSDEIKQEANDEAAAYERSARQKLARIDQRLRGDLTKMTAALREMPFEKGKDMRERPEVLEVGKLADKLKVDLSAHCVAADVVTDWDKTEPMMSVGINVVAQGSVGIRQCPAHAQECFDRAHKVDTITIHACNLTLENETVAKDSFRLEVYEDLPYGSLRLRILL